MHNDSQVLNRISEFTGIPLSKFTIMKGSKSSTTLKILNTFISAKTIIPKSNYRLKDGFMIKIDDLQKLGFNINIAGIFKKAFSDVSFLQRKSNNLAKTIDGVPIHLNPLFFYVPYNNDKVQLHFAYDTGNKLIFFSNINEIKNEKIDLKFKILPVEKYFFEDIKNAESVIEKIYFEIFKEINKSSNYDDFLVKQMETI